MSEERYIRQEGIMPHKDILDVRAAVVGVGAIGRQVALQLGAIGVPEIDLIDFDTVEVHNLPT